MPAFVRLLDRTLVSIDRIVAIKTEEDRVAVAWVEGSETLTASVFDGSEENLTRIAYEFTLVASQMARGIIWINPKGRIVCHGGLASAISVPEIYEIPINLRDDTNTEATA